MRKIFILSGLFMLVSTFAFAVAFSPTPMRLSADEVISYNFDGSTLDIPLTMTGAPGLVKFFVFTKDKADEIIAVRNGFLGWHYVDKIDTCIYMSVTINLLPEPTILPGTEKIMTAELFLRGNIPIMYGRMITRAPELRLIPTVWIPRHGPNLFDMTKAASH